MAKFNTIWVHIWYLRSYSPAAAAFSGIPQHTMWSPPLEDHRESGESKVYGSIVSIAVQAIKIDRFTFNKVREDCRLLSCLRLFYLSISICISLCSVTNWAGVINSHATDKKRGLPFQSPSFGLLLFCDFSPNYFLKYKQTPPLTGNFEYGAVCWV